MEKIEKVTIEYGNGVTISVSSNSYDFTVDRGEVTVKRKAKLHRITEPKQSLNERK